MSHTEDIGKRREIAEGLLQGHRLGEAWGGFAPCPGEGRHTGKSGVKDFRVILEGAPTGHCVHRSCAEDVDAWNLELRRQVWRAEHGGAMSDGTRGKRSGEVDDMRNVAAMPKEEQQGRIRALDRAAVERVVTGVPSISREWLRQRSPVDVKECGMKGFFSALYEPGERVLVFTRFTSQGDFAWWEGRGGFRLHGEPGKKAVESELPAGGRCGVWFLANPCDLQWHPVKMMTKEGRKLSRRSEPGVTCFRYLVLESDELEEALWLKVLVKLKLPIAAVYTSGSRSVHALIRVDAAGKAEWDLYRNEVSPLLTALGADGAAMSAVRLSRLPFTVRRGTEKRDGTYVAWERPGKQELLWLDPAPDGRGMIVKPVKRI